MRPAILSLVTLLAIATLARAEEPKAPDAKPAETKSDAKPDQAALEKKFEETLNNAALVGSFTMRGKEDDKPSKERYVISSVKKDEGDYWIFNARIQYGKHDVTLPLKLRVVWAGNTPVITLDKLFVPGFGSFTCRILIFDNQYAGTWDGGKYGGHMFGRIERADAPAAASDKSKEKSATENAPSSPAPKQP
jgi:hypothetical protein